MSFTYINKLFSDMTPVVRVWVVGVHVLDGVENTDGVEGVVVLVDVILDHDVEEVPANIVIRCDTLVSI